jgi:3-oxoacyl-[acyl-carrier protein] reductase
MNFWKGRVVFITGGGGGIGRAFALLVARQGASIVAVDADGSAADETASLVGSERALAVRADVSSEKEIREAVDLALSRFKKIDVLHNNASILRRNDKIEDMSLDEFSGVIAVNSIGMFLAARAVVPIMKQTGGGVIVNMSSRGGARGQGHTLAYSLTKAGVLSFTRGLAEQLRPFNIRVNALNSGLVETGMTRGGAYLERARQNKAYVFQPDEMANAVAYAAEREDLTGSVFEYFGGPVGPEMHLLGDFTFENVDVPFAECRS